MTVLVLALALQAVASGDAPGLATALENAAPHDTVWLAAGVHRGPLVLRRAVILCGEEGAALIGDGQGDVIEVLADGAGVCNLTVTGSGRDLSDEAAGIRIRARDVTVTRVELHDVLHGIYVQDAAFVVLEDNTIAGDPTLREADRGNGIHLHASRHVRLLRNTIRGVRDGLYFSYADSTEAIGNEVADSRYGIHYMYSRENRFVANRFHHNAAGAALMYSWNLRAAGNTFADHRSYRGLGMLLHRTEGARLVANRFVRNTIAISLDDAVRGAITENLIAANGIGLFMIPSSVGNVIVGNTFASNGVDARRVDGEDHNTWTARGRGNWWSNARGLDLDRDGVRDRPHREGSAFGALAVRRPALLLWRSSPAMSVLNTAEVALPVFTVPSVVDSAPLLQPPFDGPLGHPSHPLPLLGLATLAMVAGAGALRLVAGAGP